jgi:hypothetical protein
MLVTLYLSSGREKKKEKHKPRLVYLNALSHTSPNKITTIATYVAKLLFQV